MIHLSKCIEQNSRRIGGISRPTCVCRFSFNHPSVEMQADAILRLDIIFLTQRKQTFRGVFLQEGFVLQNTNLELDLCGYSASVTQRWNKVN